MSRSKSPPAAVPVGRRAVLGLAASAGALSVLTACGQTGGNIMAEPVPTPARPAVPVTGDVIGQGATRVALLIPRSASGQAAGLANQLRQAAELALRDFQGADLTILVKDDGGSTEGAQAAVQQAIAEGAKLVLGPLFAPAVRGAAGPARAAGVPIIAFSTDESVATRGIYLLGFLPSQDASRIVSFAASQGRRSFAGLLPDNAYGTVIEGPFRTAVASAGARLVMVERYGPDSMGDKVAAIAKIKDQIDAIFLPDAAGNAERMATSLQSAGVDLSKVKLLGSIQWDDPATYTSPSLVGGWFPAPDQGGIAAFRQRFRAAFGADPSRVTVLGYEAAILAAGLVRSAGPQPFRDDVLLSRNGFAGTTGVFRFNPEGTNQRGLAIYEVAQGGARVLAPAPRTFAGA